MWTFNIKKNVATKMSKFKKGLFLDECHHFRQIGDFKSSNSKGGEFTELETTNHRNN